MSADKCAFPSEVAFNLNLGLTRREYFAVRLLPTAIGQHAKDGPFWREEATKSAVQWADRLIAELEK
jgi:hypothetical protein